VSSLGKEHEHCPNMNHLKSAGSEGWKIPTFYNLKNQRGRKGGKSAASPKQKNSTPKTRRIPTKLMAIGDRAFLQLTDCHIARIDGRAVTG
jgi:hypothetical protein